MTPPDTLLDATALAQLEREATTLPELSARAARLWPDAPALHFDESGEMLSFAEVESRSSRYAHTLVSLGIAPGDKVAVMLDNRWEFAIAWLGISKAGGAMVPLNVRYRGADAAFILSHSEARGVITSTKFMPLLRELPEDVTKEPWLVDVDDSGPDGMPCLAAARPETPPAIEVHARTTTNIQYTSGTTGHPKGCVLPNGYWLALGRKILADLAPLGPGDVMLTAQPCYYIDPQWNIATALLSGAKLVVLDGFHPSTLWRRIRDYRATFFYCLGSMPTLLLKMPSDPRDRDHQLRLVAASAIPPSQHRALEERFGVPWVEVFGMTETGADIAVRAHDHDELVGSGCLGTPMTYREADVFDERDRPLPPDVVGELVLRGPWMMDGYFRNPEATAECFRGGWLHTGDLARKDAKSRFYHVGRKKEMIRRSGENIAAAEIEEVIAAHPAVLNAACIPVPDETRGEEIKACIVLKAGASQADVPPDVIAGWCAERIAGFKVPRYWAYLDDLPRTPSERIAKQKLVSAQDDLRKNAFDRIDGIWR